jgi:phosphatidylglycerol:prolipoprotein diacylglycerol transferase
MGGLVWRCGGRLLKKPGHSGEIFCYYLIFTGVARFLVEIIRINPPWILGLSNAQVASVASVIAGCLLLLRLRLVPAASR